MDILRTLGTVILLGLIIGGGFGSWFYNKPHRDISAEQSDFKLSADKLFNEFNNNTEQANDKYLENVVEVDGTVKETSKDEKGRISIVLQAEKADMGGVNARFTEEQIEKASQISKGDDITIKCRCIGYESDLFKEVRLDNCSFVNY